MSISIWYKFPPNELLKLILLQRVAYLYCALTTPIDIENDQSECVPATIRHVIFKGD